MERSAKEVKVVSKKSKTARKLKKRSTGTSKAHLFRLVFKSPLLTRIAYLSAEKTIEAIKALEALYLPMMKQSLAVGFNEVIKGLEKGTVSMVILSKTHQASTFLLSHIPSLCCKQSIPIIALTCDSKQLGPLVNLKTALAIGFKRDQEISRIAAEELFPFSSNIDAPWISHPKQLRFIPQ